MVVVVVVVVVAIVVELKLESRSSNSSSRSHSRSRSSSTPTSIGTTVREGGDKGTLMFGELFWNHNLRLRWTGSNQAKDFMGCCRRWSDFPSSPRLTQGNSPIHLHRHCMSPQYIRSTWD